MASVVACIVVDAPLVSNSNRTGTYRSTLLVSPQSERPLITMSTSRLPRTRPISDRFPAATKNSIVSLLLGPGNGWEKLNFIHRWSGRIMFLGSMLHGALWIQNHLEYDLPIIGQRRRDPVLRLSDCSGVVVLSSLPFVGRWACQVFYVVQ